MRFVIPGHKFVFGLIFRCLHKIRIYIAQSLVSDKTFLKIAIPFSDSVIWFSRTKVHE